jgi:hypothetical protein
MFGLVSGLIGHLHTRLGHVLDLAATEASGDVARQQKSRMSMKVPSTTTLSCPILSPLLTAGKNIVGYFLDRPCTSNYSATANLHNSQVTTVHTKLFSSLLFIH